MIACIGAFEHYLWGNYSTIIRFLGLSFTSIQWFSSFEDNFLQKLECKNIPIWNELGKNNFSR